MKKFLSVFIAVAMVLSFATMFAASPMSAPVAKANTTASMTLTDGTSTLYWYHGVPSFSSSGTVNHDVYYVYTMGDTIHGYISVTPNAEWTVELRRTTDNSVVDSVTMAAGSSSFTIGTGNVDKDGTYYLYASGTYISDPHTNTTDTFTAKSENIFIKYHLTWNHNAIDMCKTSQTVDGWITRGNGQTVLVGVDVYLAYPDNTLAGYYHVTPNSSGQFTITFPVDPNNQAKYVGTYRLYIRDGYDTNQNPDNDAIIYDTLSNVPSDLSLNLSTYISPTLLYKNTPNQPILLVLKDQHGNFVSGATIITTNVGTTWKKSTSYSVGDVVFPTTSNGFYYKCTVAGTSGNTEPTWPTTAGTPVTDGSVTWKTYSIFTEISPGFYRSSEINTSDTVDVRFRAVKEEYGKTFISNTVIVNLRDLGVFNPYVDVWTSQEKYKFDTMQTVYDKLPCTVGNAFWVKVDSWPIPDNMQPNWVVVKKNYYDTYWGIKGDNFWFLDDSDDPPYYNPYLSLGDAEHILITKAGKISVSIHMLAWQRAHTSCTKWPIYKTVNGKKTYDYDTMSTNACCHTFDKTFDICEAQSCTYGGVTLTGSNVTDATTVEVGKKVDQLSLSIDPAGAPADLTCSCPNYIVVMYMVDGKKELVKNAFTVDTYTGKTASGSVIWYNPQGVSGPGIPDQPISRFEKESGIYEPVFDENGNVVTDAHGNPEMKLVSNGLKFGDCPFNLYGITFNYPTGTNCHYRLVVKVFGLERTFDTCGGMHTTYPLIAEDFNPITVTPEVVSGNTTYTITEGNIDPDEILAGVTPIIDITDPVFPGPQTGFSYDLGVKGWKPVKWAYYFNGRPYYNINFSKTDNGYRFAFSKALYDEGTLEFRGYSYNADCTTEELVDFKIQVVKPEFTVQLGLSDGSVIDNDGIITEGLAEKIYVSATDPRGIHDFSTDPNWTLEAVPEYNDCEIPLTTVCYDVPSGCTQPSPIEVTAFANPNVNDDPMFKVYFVSNGAYIYVDEFKVVEGTAKVDPQEVPYTVPPTATHVTLTVKDAHGHGIPGVSASPALLSSAGGSGYYSTTTAKTNNDGEMDWMFTPLQSGEYKLTLWFSGGLCKVLPCGWGTGTDSTAPYIPLNADLTIVAKYTPDTQPPTITISAPKDGATVDTDTVTVEGDVYDNVGVTELYVGTQKIDFAPDGSFSATVSLAEGVNTIKVTAFDAAGNKAEKDLTVTYKKPAPDTQPPTIVLTSPEDGATVDTDTVTVEGDVYDNVGVTELYVGTQKIDFNPDGEFSATVSLAEGANTIKVIALDAAGNKAEKDLTVTYKKPAPDTQPPTITITAPKDGATVDTDTVTVSGTVTDNVGVASLYIGATKVDFAPDGSFSATVSLAEGKNVIKVFAFDAAGNKAEKDLTVTYKKPAPPKKTIVTVQIGSDVMTVNGEVEQLDVAPVIHEGHTYLPLRAIAEALGAKVDWIAATKGITLTLGKNSVGLQIGNVSAVVNGNVIAIFPPYLQPYGDGTYAATMVPLRVIAEGLGATVSWDPATRVVTITLVQQP